MTTESEIYRKMSTEVKRKRKEEEGEGEEEEGEEHCTTACQHANKIECVCGCGGKNHGIKSIVKMDTFFFEHKEKEKKEGYNEEEEYNRGIKDSADYFFKEFARLYYEK